jgi:hypothetical protein
MRWLGAFISVDSAGCVKAGLGAEGCACPIRKLLIDFHFSFHIIAHLNLPHRTSDAGVLITI